MVLENLAYRPFDGSITDHALDVLADYGLAPSLIGRHVMIARLVGAAQEYLPGGERHLSTRPSRDPIIAPQKPLGAAEFLSKVLVLFQRHPSQTVDLDALHVERAVADDDALGGRGGKSGLDQLGDQSCGKAVCEH